MKTQKHFLFILSLCLVIALIPMQGFADNGSATNATTGQSDSAAAVPEQPDTAITVSEQTAPAASFSDIKNHWANAAVQRWAGLGIIKGDSGKFRPDDPISRAEVAVILDNLMGYQTKSTFSFSDVPSNAWYTDAILKANAAGILSGDGKGHASPSEKISREQAAVMLARAFGVEKMTGTGTSFTDALSISDWAKPLVFGMEADHYIGGMKDGSFSPKASITRAQLVTMIDNAVVQYYASAGTYTDKVAPKFAGGNCVAIVRTSGVTLKGSAIDGDLIIAEGVAQGDFTLDSTAVKGKMIARGGGENSIHVINGAEVNGTVSIEKVDGAIRIVSNGVVIANLDADAEVILEGSFTNINVAQGAEVEVRGQVNHISMEAAAAVAIAKDAKVDSLTVAKNAEGAKIVVAGSVTDIKTEAPKTEIIAKDTAKIATLEASSTAEGTKVAIDGKAEINKINADTSVTTSGDGAPGAITGMGTVKQSGGGGGGGGGGGSVGGGGGGETSDTTAPTITSGAFNRTSGTNAEISFTSSEVGSYYISVVAHNATSGLSTAGSGTAFTTLGKTVSVTVGDSAKDVYVRVKDASGNLSNTILFRIPEYFQYGVVKSYTAPDSFDNARVKLYRADDSTSSRYLTSGFNPELKRGQLIGYDLEDGDIYKIATSGAIYADSGFNMQSQSSLSIGGFSYGIDSNAVVFAYNGISPGALICNYTVYSIDNVYLNQSAVSPASVYLDSQSHAAALLVPSTMIKVFAPTGLKGIAPTTAANNDGTITGILWGMEYKLSDAAIYSPISGDPLTGLAAGTYYVRYKANGSNPAGPATKVIVPEFVAADSYGLVTAFQGTGYYDNPKVKLLLPNEERKTYYFCSESSINLEMGTIVYYGLNEDDEIAALSTNGYVAADSGMTVYDADEVTINGNSYSTSDDIIVFTYEGASPSAASAYHCDDITNVIFHNTFNTPASIYLNEDGDAAVMLLPIGAVHDNKAGINVVDCNYNTYVTGFADSDITTDLVATTLSGIVCGINHFEKLAVDITDVTGEKFEHTLVLNDDFTVSPTTTGCTVTIKKSYLNTLNDDAYKVYFSAEADGIDYYDVLMLYVVPAEAVINYSQPDASFGTLSVKTYNLDAPENSTFVSSGSSAATGGNNYIMIEYTPNEKEIRSITIEEKYYGITKTYDLTADYNEYGFALHPPYGEVTIKVEYQ